MIATFVLEIGMLAYSVWRYRLNSIGKIAGLLLLLLATFQLAEFNVCEGYGMSAEVWSRVGYIAIALLPAFGMHLVLLISGKKHLWWLAGAAYAMCAVFVGIFGLHQNAFITNVCTGNYVIFHLQPPIGGIFFMYYYFWLFVGIALCMYWSTSAAIKTRKALLLQAGGYLSFVLPTAVANTMNPATIAGLPSIMCGFAVVYALVLAFGILPLVGRKK